MMLIEVELLNDIWVTRGVRTTPKSARTFDRSMCVAKRARRRGLATNNFWRSAAHLRAAIEIVSDAHQIEKPPALPPGVSTLEP
jgi:hypothetical protein